MSGIAEGIGVLLDAAPATEENFTKQNYEDSFHDFLKENRTVYREICELYREGDAVVREAAIEEFVGRQEERLNSEPKKRIREQKLLDMGMALVVYVLPGFLEEMPQDGKEAAEVIVKHWKMHFPKTNLGVSSFETINEGFRHRFCYITTAVCQSLGKTDDCYELNLLRDYRDRFLLSSDEGETVVKEYYDVAPSIVKHINKCEDHDEIYKKIWENYLKSCISFIENGEDLRCMELYSEMVYKLKNQYFT